MNQQSQQIETQSEQIIPAPEENLNEDPAANERARIIAETKEKLQRVVGSEARVRTFAKIMDKYGADAIIGLIPELGDGATSAVAGIYLLAEARNADLDTSDYLKIIGLQGADFFVGAVPIIGDVADYFFKANNWSADYFTKKKEEIIEKALAAGVTESEIAMIGERATKLPQLADKAISLVAEATV